MADDDSHRPRPGSGGGQSAQPLRRRPRRQGNRPAPSRRRQMEIDRAAIKPSVFMLIAPRMKGWKGGGGFRLRQGAQAKRRVVVSVARGVARTPPPGRCNRADQKREEGQVRGLRNPLRRWLGRPGPPGWRAGRRCWIKRAWPASKRRAASSWLTCLLGCDDRDDPDTRGRSAIAARGEVGHLGRHRLLRILADVICVGSVTDGPM